jgi:hypothetical protein
MHKEGHVNAEVGHPVVSGLLKKPIFITVIMIIYSQYYTANNTATRFVY